jgi:hypothetical protein
MLPAFVLSFGYRAEVISQKSSAEIALAMIFAAASLWV